MNFSSARFRAKLWVALSTLWLCIASVALVFVLYYQFQLSESRYYKRLIAEKQYRQLSENRSWRRILRAASAISIVMSLCSLVWAERNLRRLGKRKLLLP